MKKRSVESVDYECQLSSDGGRCYFMIGQRLFTYRIEEEKISFVNSRYLMFPETLKYFQINEKLGLLILILSKKEDIKNSSETPTSIPQSKNFFAETKILRFDLLAGEIIDYHTFKKKDLITIRMNKNFILCVFKYLVKLYHCYNFKHSVQRYESGANNEGCCAISSRGCVIAFPGKQAGLLVVVKNHEKYLNQDEWMNVIRAHETRVVIAKLNDDGSLVASCSTKGTLIRVFESKGGKKLYEFRRGTTQRRVVDISFDSKSRNLLVLSETGTLHLFQLAKENQYKSKVSINFMSRINELFSAEWGFGKFRGIEFPERCSFQKNISSSCTVLTKKGDFYSVKFDLQKGGKPIAVRKTHITSVAKECYSLVESIVNVDKENEEKNEIKIVCKPRDKSIEQIIPNYIIMTKSGGQTMKMLAHVIKVRMKKKRDLFLFVAEKHREEDEEVFSLFQKHKESEHILSVEYDVKCKHENFCRISRIKMEFKLSRHSVSKINNERSLIYGGVCVSKGKFEIKNMLREVSFVDNETIFIKEINLGLYGTTTPSLHSHTSFFDSEYLDYYVFAGANEKTFFNTLYNYSMMRKKWVVVSMKGQIPEKRIDTALVFRTKERKAIVWGGFLGSMRSGEYGNKLYELDVDTKVWSIVKPESDIFPIGRSKHFIVLYNNEKDMLLHGGTHDLNMCFDTWSFNFTNKKWRRISIYAPSPAISCVVFKDNYLATVSENIKNVYVFNIIKKTWKKVFLKKEKGMKDGEEIKEFSSCGSICGDKKKLYILGGETKDRKSTDDIFVFDFGSYRF